MTIQFFAVKLEDDLQHTAPIDGIMPFAYWLLTLACLADFYLCFFLCRVNMQGLHAHVFRFRSNDTRQSI